MSTERGFDRSYFYLAGVRSSRPFEAIKVGGGDGKSYINWIAPDIPNDGKDKFITDVQLAWDYFFGGIDET